MLILVWKENEQDQAHMFKDIYLESFQIHQLTIMYCKCKNVNHDNLINSLF